MVSLGNRTLFSQEKKRARGIFWSRSQNRSTHHTSLQLVRSKIRLVHTLSFIMRFTVQNMLTPDYFWRVDWIQYYAVLYCNMICYTILYSTVLCYVILYYTVLKYTILYYNILYCTILYYTAALYYALYCTTLCSTSSIVQYCTVSGHG